MQEQTKIYESADGTYTTRDGGDVAAYAEGDRLFAWDAAAADAWCAANDRTIDYRVDSCCAYGPHWVLD